MNSFHDLRELGTETLRDIVTQSGVVWPEGGLEVEYVRADIAAERGQ